MSTDLKSTDLKIFTSGIWRVKPGKEPEFVNAWEDFATWVGTNVGGAIHATLLQDLNERSLFISFGPWESLEAVNKWRELPEFADFVARARELCESGEPHTMKVVVDLAASRKAA